MTATDFLMKPLSPPAKVTHFLFLSLFLPPLAVTAAPNSSQGRICINLIKLATIIGVDSYILFLQTISPCVCLDSRGWGVWRGQSSLSGENVTMEMVNYNNTNELSLSRTRWDWKYVITLYVACIYVYGIKTIRFLFFCKTPRFCLIDSKMNCKGIRSAIFTHFSLNAVWHCF